VGICSLLAPALLSAQTPIIPLGLLAAGSSSPASDSEEKESHQIRILQTVFVFPGTVSNLEQNARVGQTGVLDSTLRNRILNT
jgi:hypothetical protein